MQSEGEDENIKITGKHDFLRELGVLLNNGSFPEENTCTLDFLEAMQAWLEAFEGRNTLFEEENDRYITWSDLFKLIQAAGIYE